jgi:hypothetical protein
MLELVAKEPEGEKSSVPQQPGDNLNQLLLQSIQDAAQIVKEAGIQFSNDELRRLATTLFIQRTRLA